MRARIISVLLAVAVLTSAGIAAGVPNANPQDSQTTTEDDARVAFGDGEIRTERGGTVPIPIELNATDTATVKIGSDDAVNYALVVTVTDGDDDGTVTISFDTDAVAEDDATKVTTHSDADSATVRSEVEYMGGDPPHPSLEPGNYPLELFAGNSTDTPLASAAQMVIEESDTTTRESTETTEESTTTTDIVTEPEPTETTTDDAAGDVPGFGPIVALIAVTAAAMLVGRR